MNFLGTLSVTLQAATPQNGQTHSNNSLAFAEMNYYNILNNG